MKIFLYITISLLFILCPLTTIYGTDERQLFRGKPNQIERVRFHELELEVPNNSSGEELSVGYGADNELSGIRVPRGFRALSRPYQFGPDGMRFKPGNLLKCRFKITPEMLPGGYQAEQVRLYYINRDSKRLEPVYDYVLHQDGTFEAGIQHFSSYVPGVVPDWDGEGIAPYMDYINNGEESVSTCGLKLNILAPIYSLPGRGGLNFNLSRSYNPDASTYDPFYICDNWNFDMLYYFQGGIHIPGGGTYSIPYSYDGSSKIYDRGVVFKAIYKDDILSEIQLQDGTIMHVVKKSLPVYDSSGVLIGYSDFYVNNDIVDPNGNKITYTYGSTTYNESVYILSKLRITQVTDTAGRQFKFAKDTTGYKVTQVLNDGTQRQIFKQTHGSNYDEFSDVLGRTTKYEYNSTNDITKITYPNGSRTEYQYVKDKVMYDTDGLKENRVDEHTYYKPGETTPFKRIYYTQDTGKYSVTIYDGTKIRKVTLTNSDPKGYPEKEEIFDLNNRLLKQTINNYYKVGEGSKYGRPKTAATQMADSYGTLGVAATYEYQYDNWGNTIYLQDPSGTITRMAYANTNSEKNLSTFSDVPGITYEDAKYPTVSNTKIFNLLVTRANFMKNPLANSLQLGQVHCQYDAKGNLILQSILKSANTKTYLETRYFYDASGNALSSIDPKYNEVKYEYSDNYKSAYLTRVYQPDKNQTLATYTYDFDLGKPLTVTDPKQNTYRYGYDLLGRCTSQSLVNSDPKVGVAKTIAYDDANSRVTIRYGNDTAGWQEGVIDYDPLIGKPVKVQRKFNGDRVTIKENGYDPAGHLAWTKDNLGHQIYFSYDALDRNVATTFPDNTTLYNGWSDHILTTTDAKGNFRTDYYDQLNRLVKTEEHPDPDNTYVTEYFYDTAGHLLKTRSPRGTEIINTYNPLGQLIQVDYPDPAARETFVYDDAGNLVQKTGPNGTKAIEYEFFGGYRISKVNEPGNRAIGYTYDNNNNLLTITAPGTTYTYGGYDARNRAHNFSAVLDNHTFHFNYDYDVYGRVTSIGYPNRTQAVTYTYDDFDRLLTIPGFIDTPCGYDGDGKLTAMTYANGITNSYSYNVMDRLTGIAVGPNGSILKLDYSYDPIGNISQINNTKSNQINSDYYNYDGLSRLVWSGDKPQDQLSGASGMNWSYDSMGNFDNKLVYQEGQVFQNTGFSNDLSNRLLSMGNTSFAYDTSGDCIRKSNGTLQWDYSYDQESRLTSVAKNGTVLETYGYDGNGIRYKTTNGGQTVYYVYNGGVNPIMEYSENNDSYKYYIYANGKVIAEAIKKDSSDTVKFLHQDHLGSTRAITDQGGNLVTRMDYDAFGKVKPIFTEKFSGSDLSGWTVHAANGTGFGIENNALKISHNTTDYNGDYLVKEFDNPLTDLEVEFDAKIGIVNNDSCSLDVECGSFNLTAYGNKLYYRNRQTPGDSWHYVGLILQEQWNHFKLVLTAKTVEIYINDQLQYSADGSFGVKSYLGFRDYGLCMGPVVNYVDNVTITPHFGEYDFTGKKISQDTGLLYFGARWYDPEVGRFISVDPVKDGMNWYAYCYNNPVKNIDPNGLEVYVGRNQVTPQISVFGFTLAPATYHTFVLVTDKPIDQANPLKSTIMEAGPNWKEPDDRYAPFGTLEYQYYNSTKDVLKNPDKYDLQEVSTPAQYNNWSDFADAIINSYKSYSDMTHPDYDFLPTIEGRNSNSFTGSLLRDNGSNWLPNYSAPGWDLNIDFSVSNNSWDSWGYLDSWDSSDSWDYSDSWDSSNSWD